MTGSPDHTSSAATNPPDAPCDGTVGCKALIHQPRCVRGDLQASSAATVVQEMLEPCGDFHSKLEWLAFWLDGMDSILVTVGGEPLGSDVQTDLRRWAVMLRGE